MRGLAGKGCIAAPRRSNDEPKELPGLALVWLEEGLADGRGGPLSDIDIRFAWAARELSEILGGGGSFHQRRSGSA